VPCYGLRQRPQVIQNIPDPSLLAEALGEMGFKVTGKLSFTFTGNGNTGSYREGRLTSERGIDLAMLAKYTAVANIKKQVSVNNEDKYKKTKLTLHKHGEFKYSVTKKG
jgi:hypothetical protein